MRRYLTRSLTLSAATGGAGVATASGSIGLVPSRLVAVKVRASGAPATTDITLTDHESGRVVSTFTNLAVAVKYQEPSVPAVDNTGANTTTLVAPFVGTIDIAVAQSDPGAVITVVLVLEA